MGNRILVILNDGRVFGHDLAGSNIGPAFRLAGPPVAFKPEDRWVVTMGNRILVILNDGRVFGHDLANNNIGPAFQLAGPPVAFKPEDRWVVTMGNRILVIQRRACLRPRPRGEHDLVAIPALLIWGDGPRRTVFSARLATKGHIKARVKELQAELAETYVVTCAGR